MIPIVIRLFDLTERTIVIGCFFGISVLVFSGVLSRFFFSYSIAWTEELVRFLFMWGSLFGASAAFKSDSHGGLPIIIERLPLATQKRWQRVIILSILCFLLFLAYQTLGNTLRAYSTQQMSMTTGVPVWVVNGGVCLGFIFGSIRNAQALMRSFRN